MSKWLVVRQRDCLALAILVIGVTVFHAAGLAPGQTFLPVDLANNNLPWRSGEYQPLQNTLISDPLYEFYPFLVYAVNTIRDGAWPLWNPYILLGHPVSGDPIAQPFYPVFAGLGAILGAARGLAIGLWLHAVLAALLTYAYLRAIHCRPTAALLGAYTYAIGGYLVTWFEAMHRTSTLAWLPGILWAFERSVRSRRLRYLIAGAAMMALAILGGQFQFVVTFCLFFGLYAAGRAAESFLRRDKASYWPLVAMLAIAALGALLGAIQLVPFWEALSGSQRVLSRGLTDPLAWRQLLTVIIPDFYGNPTLPGEYRGQLNFSEATVYAGVVALLLACLAPLGQKHRFSRYLLVLALALTYFAVGGPGVQALGALPVLKYVSLHRSVFLLPLLIATLAAMAVSERELSVRAAFIIACLFSALVWVAIRLNWGDAAAHWQDLRRPVLRAAVLLALACILLLLRKHLRRVRWLADAGLAALVFADLFLFGSRFSPSGPIEQLMPPTPVIEYLRAHAGLLRVVAYQSGDVLFGPNVLSIYDLAAAGGYSSIVPGRYRQLVRAGDPKTDVWWMDVNSNMIAFSHPSRRLLDLLQVGYIISAVPLDEGVRAEVAHDGCSGDTGEIAATHTVSGTFSICDTVINRLDLRFRVYRPGQATGQLSVKMWEGAHRARLMLDVQLDAAQLQDNEVVTLYFEPERDAPGRTYAWEICAANGVSHTGVALCAAADGQPALAVYGSDLRQVYQGEVYAYERLTALPKAYVVYAVEEVADDSEAVSRLLDSSFDVRSLALAAEPLDMPAVAEVRASPAEILEYRDARVVVRATAAQRGLLVLGDQFDPGWRASIDGQPAKVLRVDDVLRGVIVPPGEHEVTFEFAPNSLRVGLLLSLSGVLLLAALVVIIRRARMAA
jgi:hypothetical protein